MKKEISLFIIISILIILLCRNKKIEKFSNPVTNITSILKHETCPSGRQKNLNSKYSICVEKENNKPGLVSLGITDNCDGLNNGGYLESIKSKSKYLGCFANSKTNTEYVDINNNNTDLKTIEECKNDATRFYGMAGIPENINNINDITIEGNENNFKARCKTFRKKPNLRRTVDNNCDRLYNLNPSDGTIKDFLGGFKDGTEYIALYQKENLIESNFYPDENYNQKTSYSLKDFLEFKDECIFYTPMTKHSQYKLNNVTINDNGLVTSNLSSLDWIPYNYNTNRNGVETTLNFNDNNSYVLKDYTGNNNHIEINKRRNGNILNNQFEGVRLDNNDQNNNIDGICFSNNNYGDLTQFIENFKGDEFTIKFDVYIENNNTESINGLKDYFFLDNTELCSGPDNLNDIRCNKTRNRGVPLFTISKKLDNDDGERLNEYMNQSKYSWAILGNMPESERFYTIMGKEESGTRNLDKYNDFDYEEYMEDYGETVYKSTLSSSSDTIKRTPHPFDETNKYFPDYNSETIFLNPPQENRIMSSYWCNKDSTLNEINLNINSKYPNKWKSEYRATQFRSVLGFGNEGIQSGQPITKGAFYNHGSGGGLFNMDSDFVNGVRINIDSKNVGNPNGVFSIEIPFNSTMYLKHQNGKQRPINGPMALNLTDGNLANSYRDNVKEALLLPRMLEGNDDEWLQIDLGNIYSIKGVNINSEYRCQVQVLVSLNEPFSSKFVQLGSSIFNLEEGYNELHLDTPMPGKLVRIKLYRPDDTSTIFSIGAGVVVTKESIIQQNKFNILEDYLHSNVHDLGLLNNRGQKFTKTFGGVRNISGIRLLGDSQSINNVNTLTGIYIRRFGLEINTIDSSDDKFRRIGYYNGGLWHSDVLFDPDITNNLTRYRKIYGLRIEIIDWYVPNSIHIPNLDTLSQQIKIKIQIFYHNPKIINSPETELYSNNLINKSMFLIPRRLKSSFENVETPNQVLYSEKDNTEEQETEDLNISNPNYHTPGSEWAICKCISTGNHFRIKNYNRNVHNVGCYGYSKIIGANQDKYFPTIKANNTNINRFNNFKRCNNIKGNLCAENRTQYNEMTCPMVNSIREDNKGDFLEGYLGNNVNIPRRRWTKIILVKKNNEFKFIVNRNLNTINVDENEDNNNVTYQVFENNNIFLGRLLDHTANIKIKHLGIYNKAFTDDKILKIINGIDIHKEIVNDLVDRERALFEHLNTNNVLIENNEIKNDYLNNISKLITFNKNEYDKSTPEGLRSFNRKYCMRKIPGFGYRDVETRYGNILGVDDSYTTDNSPNTRTSKTTIKNQRR